MDSVSPTEDHYDYGAVNFILPFAIKSTFDDAREVWDDAPIFER
jgi:hypothetical protein